MARREPNRTPALEVSVRVEPIRLSPAGVAQADEAVVPLRPRTPSRAAHREPARRERTMPPVGRRAVS